MNDPVLLVLIVSAVVGYLLATLHLKLRRAEDKVAAIEVRCQNAADHGIMLAKQLSRLQEELGKLQALEQPKRRRTMHDTR